MKNLCFIFALISVATAGAGAGAEPEPGYRGPFWRMVQCGGMDELNAKLAIQAFMMIGDLQKSSEAITLIQKIDTCLDSKIGAAVEVAKGHDDARNAVKDYFIVRKSYVDGLYPHPGETHGSYSARIASAHDVQDQKFERAKLEWELAKLPTAD